MPYRVIVERHMVGEFILHDSEIEEGETPEQAAEELVRNITTDYWFDTEDQWIEVREFIQ